jgi:hypothetical protein
VVILALRFPRESPCEVGAPSGDQGTRLAADTRSMHARSRSLRRRRLVLVAVVAAVGLAGSVGQGVSAPRDQTRTSWILTGWNMHLIARDRPSIARHFFDTPLAYADGNRRRQNQVVRGFSSTATLKYESYADLASDLAHGRTAPGIRTVLYDPERWPRTPGVEQRDPATYLRRFAQLAHAHGLRVIETPARSLMAVEGARCRQNSGETLDHATLRCSLPAHAARYADVVEIQSQASQRDAGAYVSYVRTAAAQARAANPEVVVLAGLSTSPDDIVATSGDLVTAAEAVRGEVEGFYVSVCVACSGELATAEKLFEALRVRGW